MACCEGRCADLGNDADNCGTCGESCEGDEGIWSCSAGTCALAGCADGFSDCDSNATNGCETAGECSCVLGAVQGCYTADPSTQGVGACVGGTQTCNAFGTGWGPCTGEIIPTQEACANAVDDDCDGTVDEDLDADGDGWTACGGDCCDTAGPECADPVLVNPGAFEVAGNRVDDDCDGTVDNPLAACDAGLVSNSTNPLDYARAMDLCQFTTTSPATPEAQVWGVISAQLSLANGAGTPAANSRALRDGFGSAITNRFGDRLAVLSTGNAADNAGDVNPGFAPFQQGAQTGTASPFPSDWFAANGNNLPNAPGCPGPTSANAQNPVMLTLRCERRRTQTRFPWICSSSRRSTRSTFARSSTTFS